MLKDYVKKNNLTDNVIFTGFISEKESLLNIYRMFDAFVLPSIREGFPFSIVEAMSFGLPIKTSNVDGNPEAAHNGINGILVDPQKPIQIAEAIKELYCDESLRKEYGMKSEEIFNKNFLLDIMIKKTEKQYL